jgi:hypothetical protein
MAVGCTGSGRIDPMDGWRPSTILVIEWAEIRPATL